MLFLIDRIVLREQALLAFKEHLPNEPRWPNVGEKLIAKDRRIYVATYLHADDPLLKCAQIQQRHPTFETLGLHMGGIGSYKGQMLFVEFDGKGVHFLPVSWEGS